VQVGRDPHDLANLKLYMAMRRDVDDWKGETDAALEDQPGFGAIREARRDGNNPHKVSWLQAPLLRIACLDHREREEAVAI
jgi:hypothetical protein